ncbi:hypothetical protein ABIE41_002146 [Bosea sp. OAE506]|uniref:hypothetical protein n=1 Tax=Bosea sp. OAE506 TaxID=2663870 RepID=UPI00178A4D1A
MAHSPKSTSGKIGRNAATGRFVIVKEQNASWKAFGKIYEKRKDVPSKLGELFRVHNQHQSKRG